MIDPYEILNYMVINTMDDSLGAFRNPYIVFNALEALCWFYCSFAVLVRYLRQGKDRAEISYVLSFMAFAISDVIETTGTSILLLLFKGSASWRCSALGRSPWRITRAPSTNGAAPRCGRHGQRFPPAHRLQRLRGTGARIAASRSGCWCDGWVCALPGRTAEPLRAMPPLVRHRHLVA